MGKINCGYLFRANEQSKQPISGENYHTVHHPGLPRRPGSETVLGRRCSSPAMKVHVFFACKDKNLCTRAQRFRLVVQPALIYRTLFCMSNSIVIYFVGSFSIFFVMTLLLLFKLTNVTLRQAASD